MRTFDVELIERRTLAEGVISLAMQPQCGGLLPGYEPGAHVDVYLPNQQTRSYSLTSLAEASGVSRYEIAVGLSAQSRGGSAWLHEHAHAGLRLRIGEPRNHFGLHDDPAPVLLIAGGIGITPLQLMAQALSRRGRHFSLVYAIRSRAHAAYLASLTDMSVPLALHVDDEAGGRPLDVATTLAGLTPDTRIYCCGPQAMMDSVREQATRQGHDPARVHFESFAPAAQSLHAAGRFVVHLARSGRDVDIEPDRTILDTLEEHGVFVPSTCREGICGTCECRVIEGDVDHRDQILSIAEKASNRTMMVCVSRARGQRLVLDL